MPPRHRPVRRVLAVTAAMLLLGACTGTDGGAPSTGDAVTCPDGSTATPAGGPDALPTTTLSTLGGDAEVSTACWLGQPLVVNFWAEWCGPCKEEMPAFQAVHEAAGDAVRFVGVDYEDRPDAARAFAEEVGVTYDLVEDPDGAFFDALDGRGTPYTLLVEPDGTVAYRHAGPLTRSELERVLAEELDVEL